MGLIVQKYGGTSVGSLERLCSVAERIARTSREGHSLVVVVSAMGHTTDQLMGMAHALTDRPDPRELDMLLTTGEQVSIALLSMALQARGCKAVSMTGAQAGIVTESYHTRARILHIQTERIEKMLKAGYIVVVAGFQGIDAGGHWEITALGRGGSDTSAVALAAVLQADRCEIYTDVDGVFTTDPRLVSDAALLEAITSEEMLELASLGAQVLHPRAVEIARNYAVPLIVRSSWSEAAGTVVLSPPLSVPRVIDKLETDRPVDAVLVDSNQARIALLRVPDRPGVAAVLFGHLARLNIDVDLILQSIHHSSYNLDASAHGRTNDIAFTVPRADLEAARQATEAAAEELGCRASSEIVVDPAPAKVSIRGAGIIGRPGIAAQMFAALAQAGVNIQMISTSEIKISCLVAGEQATAAAQSLCKQFGLAAPIYEELPVFSTQPMAVRGVALDRNQAQLAILQVPDRPGVAAQIFQRLASQGIAVDMIVQSQRGRTTNDIGFTVSRTQATPARLALEPLCQVMGCPEIIVDTTVAKLSLVGAGIVGTPGIAACMFATLARTGANIEMISTSEIKVSCIIGEVHGEKALREVHCAFGLGSGVKVLVEGE